MYADVNGVTPKSLYLTALAIVMLFTRPPLARIGDRYGYRRVFVPCLVLICCGLACLAAGGTRFWMLLSAANQPEPGDVRAVDSAAPRHEEMVRPG